MPFHTPIDVKCPECGSFAYLSFDEDYDDEWVTLLCNCLQCKIKYQINYRAVGIDVIGDTEEKRAQREIKNAFLDLLERDRDLRLKYDALVCSECGETELKDIIQYLMDNYGAKFEEVPLPAGDARAPWRDKERYLADVMQVLCAAEA